MAVVGNRAVVAALGVGPAAMLRRTDRLTVVSVGMPAVEFDRHARIQETSESRACTERKSRRNTE